MIKLNGTEYAPELHEHYEWNVKMGSNDGEIIIQVFYRSPIGKSKVLEHITTVAVDADPVNIRARILTVMENIASKPRPWNAEYRNKVVSVIAGLFPPEDNED